MNRRSHAYLHTGFEHFCEALVSGWSAALRDEALARNACKQATAKSRYCCQLVQLCTAFDLYLHAARDYITDLIQWAVHESVALTPLDSSLV